MISTFSHMMVVSFSCCLFVCFLFIYSEPKFHQPSTQNLARFLWFLFCRPQSLYPKIHVRFGHDRFDVGNLADGTAEISQRLWLDERDSSLCLGQQSAQARNGRQVHRKLLLFFGRHRDGRVVSDQLCDARDLPIGDRRSDGQLFRNADAACLLESHRKVSPCCFFGGGEK
jgi:hypothetical protein